MNKNLLLIVIAVVLIVAGGLLIFGFSSFSKPKADITGIILFYGDGCPHCKIVDDFITENKIEDKIKFSRLEVWFNKNNQAIISKVAETCGIKGDSVGVPFLYDGKGNCVVGDEPVINFFKNEANIK